MKSQDAGSDPAIELGAYEVLQARLSQSAADLIERAKALNESRLSVFGGSEMEVLATSRVRTENNCVPRDIVAVGERMLFGYRVFIGLRKETRVEDVFSSHRIMQLQDGPTLEADAADFLQDPRFLDDFRELFEYYKDARLLQLRQVGDKLLAVFQIGASVQDIRVLRWSVSADGQVSYLDNRGERDHVFPPPHDFEWTATSRDDHVRGRHPHINILDRLFVQTIGGSLTLKVEDNTEDGQGIWNEPVDDPDQALDDADVYYAEVDSLILLKIRPYGESKWRYLVFNSLNNQVVRQDAIGLAGIQLPEGHGLIFPGGYYLRTGQTKSFETEVDDSEFIASLRSPNGEDILFIFHHREDGRSILLPYNMIRKTVENPIFCHGYSIFEDGQMVVFKAESETPTRVHHMQLWQTPFCSDAYAAAKQDIDGAKGLARIGNADLVRGVSDAFSLGRACDFTEPSRAGFEDIVASAGRALDAYYWLEDAEAEDLATPIRAIQLAAEQIIDEYEKVRQIQARTQASLAQAKSETAVLVRELRSEHWKELPRFIQGLDRLHQWRGHLASLKELRYVDLELLATLDADMGTLESQLGKGTLACLGDEAAFLPYHTAIAEALDKLEEIETEAELRPALDSLGQIDTDFRVLGEVIEGLEFDDVNQRTEVLEHMSEVLAGLNQGRAKLEQRRHELGASEARAEFAAQLSLLGQRLSSGLAMADSVANADRSLAELTLLVEDLEGRFGHFDDFGSQLDLKREEIQSAFATRKQYLQNEIQTQVEHLNSSADRILASIVRRAGTMEDLDALNAFFASDPMTLRLSGMPAKLTELGAQIQAEELESRFLAAKKEARRALQDRKDLYEDGAEIIKLGRHRFGVNREAFELALVAQEDDLVLQLTGTDFREALPDDLLSEYRSVWSFQLPSESRVLYRSAYLAAEIYFNALEGRGARNFDALRKLSRTEGALEAEVKKIAAASYEDGYDRGVHDQDAAKILRSLIELAAKAGELRRMPNSRALAMLYWAYGTDEVERVRLQDRSRSMAGLAVYKGRAGLDEQADQAASDPAEHGGLSRITDDDGHGGSGTAGRDADSRKRRSQGSTSDLELRIKAFIAAENLSERFDSDDIAEAGAYLFACLGAEKPMLVLGGEASDLAAGLKKNLKSAAAKASFEAALSVELGHLGTALAMTSAWLDAHAAQTRDAAGNGGPSVSVEAAAFLLSEELDHSDFEVRTSPLVERVEGLMGQHPSLRDAGLDLRLDAFLKTVRIHRSEHLSAFKAFQAARHAYLEDVSSRFKLDSLRPKVMSAFVRNRLIDEVYLPLIGANLAKQIGAAGAQKRTDLMGMLLLVSPPGYGKTTLMEYIASRMGLAFVKINGPALGHAVTSLDPADAPNATAAQEVEKVNFAFEMGSNVLLYVDDIQHCHPEFLQKFISLCDAQRRVEGVWQGEPKRYDLRGKRFVVCMAGNPYTESGARFRIPDMLANRADIYNLGDVLAGKDSVFELSYIENALTSNAVLAPLAGRTLQDLYALIRMAEGESLSVDALEYSYSKVEIEEILSVLQKLLYLRATVLDVNRAYIASANQADAYRSEPAFRLQGSYRNMNRLAEQIVPVMNQAELDALLADDYKREAQTLTSGAEHNLLKLAEMRGALSEEESQRWEEIKTRFRQEQAMGGSDEDPAARITGALGLLSEQLASIGAEIKTAGEGGPGARPGKVAAVPATDLPKDLPEELTNDLSTDLTPADLAKHLADLYVGLAEVGEQLARLKNEGATVQKTKPTPSSSAQPKAKKPAQRKTPRKRKKPASGDVQNSKSNS